MEIQVMQSITESVKRAYVAQSIIQMESLMGRSEIMDLVVLLTWADLALKDAMADQDVPPPLRDMFRTIQVAVDGFLLMGQTTPRNPRFMSSACGFLPHVWDVLYLYGEGKAFLPPVNEGND